MSRKNDTRGEKFRSYKNDEYKSRIPCLRCDKLFMSAHRVNIRICDKCKQSTDWVGSTKVHCHMPPNDRKHMEVLLSPLKEDETTLNRFRHTGKIKKEEKRND